MSGQSFVTAEKAEKPLRMKAYGSIGHLPDSRMGPADHHVHDGQALICTAKPRKGDRVIVSEKLDGSCMSVANIDGEIVALTRAGYRTTDVTYAHLRAFTPYVERLRSKFSGLLEPGERIVGEWMPMAHGTIYDPSHPAFAPFVAFDIRII
jgi:ATP-dependent RNA circularization protein (DNA/RNA ligase family)